VSGRSLLAGLAAAVGVTLAGGSDDGPGLAAGATEAIGERTPSPGRRQNTARPASFVKPVRGGAIGDSTAAQAHRRAVPGPTTTPGC
jgi:hypothetical protein